MITVLIHLIQPCKCALNRRCGCSYCRHCGCSGVSSWYKINSAYQPEIMLLPVWTGSCFSLCKLCCKEIHSDTTVQQNGQMSGKICQCFFFFIPSAAVWCPMQPPTHAAKPKAIMPSVLRILSVTVRWVKKRTDRKDKRPKQTHRTSGKKLCIAAGQTNLHIYCMITSISKRVTGRRNIF